MIADIKITEKSFGDKLLMYGVSFSVSQGEKVGLIGRNGVGKSTLFGILSGTDTDFSGEVTFRRGLSVVATAQEHHGKQDETVLQYILHGLPEYAKLSHIIETYPNIMGDDMAKIEEYTDALARFDQKGFYNIEAEIERELEVFQLPGVAHRPLSSLSGGQKRLIEVVKVMHAQAQLALLDEPTNHMDYVAKQQFIDWMKKAPEAMLIISHDRDVLSCVNRIVELKDGASVSSNGNYDDYLRQNTVATSTSMNEYEVTQRKIENLKKRVQYARSKKASWGGTADKRNPFVVMEQKALKEIKELEKIEKPTFWIDKTSAAELDFKVAARYQKYKARNIRLNVGQTESRSSRVLVSASDLSLGYGDNMLFSGVTFELREGEAIELRGRNGAGKSTLIKKMLGDDNIALFSGDVTLAPKTRVGVYQQEVSEDYFGLTLSEAVERIYLEKDLGISHQKIRQLASDYLFDSSDIDTPVARLSGGQKARLQIIAMLANDPQLLILDEPTNHLDLPSIEELESALSRYKGAILYVSHDGYFRHAIGGEVVEIGDKL